MWIFSKFLLSFRAIDLLHCFRGSADTPPPLPPSPKKATITKCCIHPLPVLPNTPQGKILRTALCIVSLIPRFLACSPLAHHVVTTDWGHGVCCSELSSFFPLKLTYRSHTLWCFQARDGLPNKTNSHDKISETTQIVQKLSISNPFEPKIPLARLRTDLHLVLLSWPHWSFPLNCFF